MREIRQSGSEGGEVMNLPDPYSGRVTFLNDATSRTLRIPRDALLTRSGGLRQVAVVEGDGEALVARLRDVQIGDVIGTSVAVHSGLSAGERVVVRGNERLSDGDAVRVVDR